MKYEDTVKAAQSIGETRDCAVRAVTVITGKPYSVVHEVFRRRGRRDKRPTRITITENVLRDFGFEMVDCTERFRKKGAKTVCSLEKVLPQRGAFMVLVCRHILAAKNGKVQDWTRGRRHRIKRVWRVRKIK